MLTLLNTMLTKKKQLVCSNKNVEIGLHEWHKFARLKGASVNCQLLKQKSEQLA